MNDEERYKALLNVRVALSLARGYVGRTAALFGPVPPERMDAYLRQAERDLDALMTQEVTGADVPRPQGTTITADGPLLVRPAEPETAPAPSDADDA